MENPNVQYYQVKSSTYDSNKFKYSIVDIQMENISEMIKDECIKDAIILEPEQYKNKYDEEKQIQIDVGGYFRKDIAINAF